MNYKTTTESVTFLQLMLSEVFMSKKLLKKDLQKDHHLYSPVMPPPRFKSLINKSLFILIVYSWPLADEVT